MLIYLYYVVKESLISGHRYFNFLTKEPLYLEIDLILYPSGKILQLFLVFNIRRQ